MDSRKGVTVTGHSQSSGVVQPSCTQGWLRHGHWERGTTRELQHLCEQEGGQVWQQVGRRRQGPWGEATPAKQALQRHPNPDSGMPTRVLQPLWEAKLALAGAGRPMLAPDTCCVGRRVSSFPSF